MSTYFNAQQNRVSNGVTARAQDVNGLRDEVGAAFDLLPTLTNFLNGTTYYATTAGTADALLLTLPETPTSYDDGMALRFKAASNNTGAVTVNVDSLGVRSLVAHDGTALVANDLVAGDFYEARYNATTNNFELSNVLIATLDSKVTAAQTAQTAAETAQTAAETARTAAQTAQTGAETAETNAGASATAALGSATAAASSASTASNNTGYSEEWANKAEDSLVSVAAGGNGTDEYSAKHWAAKAQGFSAGNFWTFTDTATSKTLVAFEHVSVTAAGQTITLPATPTEGDRVRISVGTFADTTIARNGETIKGNADDATINLNDATVELIYTNSNWEAI